MKYYIRTDSYNTKTFFLYEDNVYDYPVSILSLSRRGSSWNRHIVYEDYMGFERRPSAWSTREFANHIKLKGVGGDYWIEVTEDEFNSRLMMQELVS